MRFYYFCTFQQRFTCCFTVGCCIRNQALIGIVITCTHSIFIDCGVIDCHEATFILEVSIKPPEIQCSTNPLKRISPVRISRLEMSGINRVLGICLLIIIAQRLIKFTEGYPVAVTCFIRFIVLICITVLAIQFVICIIVIQRTGNIFCVWFFRKFSGFNIYYFSASLLPLFGITQGTFFSPVASAVATFINYIIAGIRKETRFGKVGWDVHHGRTITVIGCFLVLNCPRSKTDFCITIRHIAIPDVGVL